MKIFIINLARAKERRENASQQLSDAGLKFEFFDALTGDQGWQPYFESYDEHQYLINTGRKVSPGEIGCYASHRSLWEKCIQLDEPIMIMEDDFVMTAFFRDAYELTSQLINQYGYIRLQSERRGKSRLVQSMGRFNLVYYTKMPHSLMCYAMRPDIARAFIEQSKHLKAPVDVMVKKIWEHKQRLYGLSPYPITESDLSEETNITGRVKPKKTLRIKIQRFYTKASWIVKRIWFTALFNPPKPSTSD